MRRLFRNHGLSLVMLGVLFLGCFIGQIASGHRQYNSEREQQGKALLALGGYLRSAHFGEATAENWESEFLQMCIYVFATAYLYQIGSAESKDPRRRHAHEAKTRGKPPADAPWPVRHGGWVLRIYEHSLSLALLGLFLLAAVWHSRAGLRLYNEEQMEHGQPVVAWADYVTSSRFWFESLQNWQSEFLSIGTMVLLSIWLREVNSPESKRVETPHWENEE